MAQRRVFFQDRERIQAIVVDRLGGVSSSSSGIADEVDFSCANHRLDFCLFSLPSSVFSIGYFTSLMQMFHQIPRILDLQERVHSVHNVRNVCHRLPRHQVFIEEMCVNSVSCFSYFVEACFERCVLCVLPVAERVVGNPMSDEGSINQPVKLLATVFWTRIFDEIKNPQ